MTEFKDTPAHSTMNYVCELMDWAMDRDQLCAALAMHALSVELLRRLGATGEEAKELRESAEELLSTFLVKANKEAS